MKPAIYIETTIVSYLTARRSRDLIVAAHQQLTEEWWLGRRGDFELFISQSVLQEAAAGDPEDALHISVATVHGMDYLLTWNCRHIANAELRNQLMERMAEQGWALPVICTPEELIGE